MPVQRRSPEGQDTPALRSYVKFSDPDSAEFVVKDILPGEGDQRWTRDHPELRFRVQPQNGLHFILMLWIAGVTLPDTGPVTVTVKINGHVLGSIHCKQAGPYRFDRPVPPDWLHAGEPVQVQAEADKLWTSPGDGKHLGYLIQEAGFR